MSYINRKAVIIIGSNSTRMLTANLDGALSAPQRGREETRLFLSLNGERLFSPEVMARLALAVDSLKQTALLSGAGEITLLATSAVRDSVNAGALREEVLNQTGLGMRVLSGAEEALYSFLGAAYPYQEKGVTGVIDIGGGSSEVALGSVKEGLLSAQSLQLGASRLLAARPILSLKDLKPACCLVERELDRAFAPVETKPGQWLLVGGTGTALMGLLRGELLPSEPSGDEQFALEDAAAVLSRLAALQPEERSRLPGMTAGREHILPTGLVILTSLMKRLGINNMAVTARNNCDGFLYEDYLKAKP